MPASMKHVISVPWTDEERTALRQMWENGIGCTGIGRHLGRSKYSVRSRDRDAEPRAARQPRGAPCTTAWPGGAGTSTAPATATWRPHTAAAAE